MDVFAFLNKRSTSVSDKKVSPIRKKGEKNFKCSVTIKLKQQQQQQKKNIMCL